MLVAIKSIGSPSLPVLRSPDSVHLKHVHVPDISKNLISISQFLYDNVDVIEFYSTHYVVKDLTTHKVLLKGTLKNGLYQLNLGHLNKNGVSDQASAIYTCNKNIVSHSNKHMS